MLNELITNEFSQHELIRYSKQMMLPDVGISGQRKLKAKKILVIGAGGLGAPVLQYLAGAGIGVIGIVDNDTVSLSNLQRQLLYTEKDVGKAKVSVAVKALQKINPNVHYESYNRRLNADNAETLIKNYHLIIDGTDNFSSRHVINDTCFKLKKPFIYASVSQFKAQCAFFSGQEGPCYRCLFENTSDQSPTCEEGTLGPVVGLIAMIQANEAIKYCLEDTSSLLNTLLTVDVKTLFFDKITLTKNSDCTLCNELATFFADEHKAKETVETIKRMKKRFNLKLKKGENIKDLIEMGRK